MWVCQLTMAAVLQPLPGGSRRDEVRLRSLFFSHPFSPPVDPIYWYSIVLTKDSSSVVFGEDVSFPGGAFRSVGLPACR